MTKEEKFQLVQEVGETLKSKPNVYVADAGGLNSSQVSDLRRACFDAGIEMRVVKNALLVKALDAAEGDYSPLYPALKQQSSVFFVNEDITGPAKLLKAFRKGGKELPRLKGAYIDEAVFLGDDINALTELKSKDVLLGELIGLLQSPIKNLLSQLNSGANTITGVLKTLEKKGE
ncbi:MAG: 50S ribosomal protein L10 [Bacteroidia bacterium]|nr:50S ribosomal protein L10 [Bacteroidia bacterium]